MDEKYEKSESTILLDGREGNRLLCRSVQGPQQSYIKRFTRGTGPLVMDEKGLRKTEIEVLTKAEMIENELQRSEGVSKRPVNQGKNARKAGTI